jgi:membrane fusion protein, heavy metal efflux system
LKSTLFITSAAAILFSVGLTGCNPDKPTSPANSATNPSNAASSDSAKQVAAAPVLDPLTITPDASLLSRIKIGSIQEKTVAESLRVAGRLETNLYNTAKIGAPITGRISKISVRFGDQVKVGQALAEISSPELAQAQLNFLKAHSQLQLTARAVERAQLLLSADVIGTAELQRRQSEQQVAGAEKRAASDQLKALGISQQKISQLQDTGQIQSSATINASSAGVLIDMKVSQGQVVNPTDVLFVVSDLSELWGLAELPEQDSQFVMKGQQVTVQIPALADQAIVGTVAYVSDVVNPETRTVRIGVSLRNSEKKLKPSMLMTMIIQGKSTPRLVVPQSAVVRENNADYVFLKQPNGSFKLTQVELDTETSGQRPIVTSNTSKALPGNAQIVIDGAFHLNNVRQQRAVSG